MNVTHTVQLSVVHVKDLSSHVESIAMVKGSAEIISSVNNLLQKLTSPRMNSPVMKGARMTGGMWLEVFA